MVIPFAASAGWYARMLASEVGEPAPVDPRSLRRALFAPVHNPTMLSVPVAKGPGLQLSDHGNWPHRHLGALNALYGRSPFFPYLFPLIEEAYRDLPDTLPEFSQRLHDIAMLWLDTDAVREWRGNAPADPALSEVICQTALALKTKINYNLSIFDALFRLGKETVIPLLVE